MIDETVAELEPATEGNHRPETILVVDDDEAQVISLEYRLQNQGYRVLKAYNGEEARRVATEDGPDLVLLDLRLPDFDGLDVCSQLVDDPRTCCVPIIIVSAVDQPDIVRKARAVGGAYYLRKPYDPNVLLTLIEQSLRNASEFDW